MKGAYPPKDGKALRERGGTRMTTIQQDYVVESILNRLSDLENYPEEHIAPYQEFEIGANTYYFTPGGFLYRKDPWSEEVGGLFYGYLTDEVWHLRTDDG
jgi:hypothetical protein